MYVRTRPGKKRNMSEQNKCVQVNAPDNGNVISHRYCYCRVSTYTHTHAGFLCSSGHCNAFRCCKVILLAFPETLQQFFIDSLIGLNGSMMLMYLCVFDEFVLIGVCFRSGLSVSMARERVQLWF